jgi:tetratricopeptide (TPR) repeat protein
MPALLAALLLPTGPSLLVGVALSTVSLLVSQSHAQVPSAEQVAKIAQAITVRIEGATQGSGSLIKRDGNRYTVLTTWHVVSGQRLGEELDIYTPDGQRHRVEQGSIKRLDEVDLAVMNFTTLNSYEVASIGDVKSVRSGSNIYVSGFPLPTSAVPRRLFRFLDGKVIANAAVAIPNGYQLLYSNPTLPGMSGGAVLNDQGQVVGIHGQGETDIQMSEQLGVAIKTGTNQAVPIGYYSQSISRAEVALSSFQSLTADDYLAQATAQSGKEGGAKEVIRLSRQALALRPSAEAYFYSAVAKSQLGDIYGALSDYTKAMSLNLYNSTVYSNRCATRYELGDLQGAASDCTKALSINRDDENAHFNRGLVNYRLGQYKMAIRDLDIATKINPRNGDAYYNRGLVKHRLGDQEGAILDFSKAIVANPRHERAYTNRGSLKIGIGDLQGALFDSSRALEINPQSATTYNNRCLVKHRLGDQKGAVSDCSRAIAIDSRYGNAYNNRGNGKNALGDINGAIEDYRMAIGVNPQDSLAFNNLANVRRSTGDIEGACTDYKKAAYLGNKVTIQWLQSESGSWCRSMR